MQSSRVATRNWLGYKGRMRVLLLFVLAACATEGAPPRTLLVLPDDAHSCARPNEVRSTHVDLRLVLDFEHNLAHGTVTHDLHRFDGKSPLVLDTRGLVVEKITDEAGAELRFSFGQPDPIRGTALVVELREHTTKVTIAYRTGDEAEAMQWLSPEQTNGGKMPFVFTQGQAILTRTWIPLQDTPAVRVTWAAEITAPPRMVTVMSATERTVDGAVTRFRMDKPVP